MHRNFISFIVLFTAGATLKAQFPCNWSFQGKKITFKTMPIPNAHRKAAQFPPISILQKIHCATQWEK